MTITLTIGWWDLLWAVPLLCVLLFYGFVFTMSVQRHFKAMPRLAQAVSVPAVMVSYLVDVLLNVVLLSIAFMEWPQEVTVTHRMKRWKQMAGSHPRRAKLATSVCRVLNLFDPGHC